MGRYDEITDANLQKLLANVRHYYQRSLAVAQRFGGPSLYFHRKAAATAKSAFLSLEHLELIYAVLPAWGMHRMGDTKTKVVDFDRFEASINAVRKELEYVRGFDLASISSQGLRELLKGPLRMAFDTLSVSVSGARLVANSKVLHHIVPDLVPPMDRRYTLLFFYYLREKFRRMSGQREGKIRGPSDLPPIDQHCRMFRDICVGVWEVLHAPQFEAIDPLAESDEPFNTSLPKVVDNMIMAFVQEDPQDWPMP